MKETEYEIYINDCFVARVVGGWLKAFLNEIIYRMEFSFGDKKIEIKVVEE